MAASGHPGAGDVAHAVRANFEALAQVQRVQADIDDLREENRELDTRRRRRPCIDVSVNTLLTCKAASRSATTRPMET